METTTTHIADIDELGVFEGWDNRKALKEQKPWCVHCGKIVNLNSAWVLSTSKTTDFYYGFWEHGFEPEGMEIQYLLLGSTCGPKLVGQQFLKKASEVEVSKIRQGFK